MFVRQNLQQNKKLSTALAILLVLAAGVILAVTHWPDKKPKLAMAFYTDDDGKTWFEDSVYKIAPFDHNGKTAVIAEVFSYDNGNKRFCAYLAKYTPEAKAKLEAALTDARSKGAAPESVALFRDPGFIQSGMLVKLPGAGKEWIGYRDPKASDIFAIHSPDGSAVDQVFVY